jgi:multiple sugar transport system permease protein
MTATIDARRRWRTVAAVAITAVFVSPLVFMVLGSFRPPGLDPPDGFELLPPEWTLRNYQIIFQLLPLWRNIGNSFLVVAIAVPITVVVASLAGFALATTSGRAQRTLIAITVGAMLVPLTALWVPRFVLFKWLDLTDTPWPLIAPSLMATTPFYVLIFGLAYYRIPKHVFEAAQLDGLSPFQVWRKIAFPLAKPAAFAIAVLAFVAYWSNFVDPLLYVSSNENFTLSLALRSLQTLEPQNFPLLLAASVVATIPPVLAFLAAQRAFFVKTLEV